MTINATKDSPVGIGQFTYQGTGATDPGAGNFTAPNGTTLLFDNLSASGLDVGAFLDAAQGGLIKLYRRGEDRSYAVSVAIDSTGFRRLTVAAPKSSINFALTTGHQYAVQLVTGGPGAIANHSIAGAEHTPSILVDFSSKIADRDLVADAAKLDTIATGAVAEGAAGDNYATNHEADLTAHPASSIVNTPAGTITAPDVQTALNELDTEKHPVPTGTPDGSKFLRDDNTWQAPTGGNIDHTGDVVTAGAPATIQPGVVTLAKMADMATASFVGRNTAATGTPEILSSAVALGILNVESGADVTDATNVAAAGAVMDSDISAAEGMVRKTGAGTYEAIKSNLSATVNPAAATDDVTLGYAVGSRWINVTTDAEFVCLDATDAAAVWVETTAGLNASDNVQWTGNQDFGYGASGYFNMSSPKRATPNDGDMWLGTYGNYWQSPGMFGTGPNIADVTGPASAATVPSFVTARHVDARAGDGAATGTPVWSHSVSGSGAVSMGSLRVWANNATTRTATWNQTAAASFSAGRVYAYSADTTLTQSGPASFFAGGLSTNTGSTPAVVTVSGNGAFAAGSISNSTMTVSGAGAFCQGKLGGGSSMIANDGGGFAQGLSENGGTILAGQGSFARGHIIGLGNITASGGGAFAAGSCENGEISATTTGAIALGHATGDGNIKSKGAGAFVAGRAEAGGTVYADGGGSWAGGTAIGGGLIRTNHGPSKGCFAFGYAQNTAAEVIVNAAILGGFARGHADTGSIKVLSNGSTAAGSALASGSIHAGAGSLLGVGAFAHGYVNGAGSVKATGDGSVAIGSATTGSVKATGAGAAAFGVTTTGTILSSGAGAITAGSVGIGGTLSATATGAGAFGNANTQTISATGSNSFQFGVGTNSQGGSLQVGDTTTGIRLNASGAPTTVHNGDIWVASGYVYMRSNNKSIKFKDAIADYVRGVTV